MCTAESCDFDLVLETEGEGHAAELAEDPPELETSSAMPTEIRAVIGALNRRDEERHRRNLERALQEQAVIRRLPLVKIDGKVNPAYCMAKHLAHLDMESHMPRLNVLFQGRRAMQALELHAVAIHFATEEHCVAKPGAVQPDNKVKDYWIQLALHNGDM